VCRGAFSSVFESRNMKGPTPPSSPRPLPSLFWRNPALSGRAERHVKATAEGRLLSQGWCVLARARRLATQARLSLAALTLKQPYIPRLGPHPPSLSQPPRVLARLCHRQRAFLLANETLFRSGALSLTFERAMSAGGAPSSHQSDSNQSQKPPNKGGSATPASSLGSGGRSPATSALQSRR